MSLPPSWIFPPFRLDPTTGSLWRDNQLVPLPPKPFAVLATLVAHAGQVVTKDALFDAVWPDTAVTDGVLKGCIRQIRQSLGETAETPQYIITVHRRGYRFLAPVTSVTSPPATSSLSAAAPMAPDVSTHGPPPRASALMVGREAELIQLHQWWARARQGGRQVVFITGEAGIGKTTVIDAFVTQVVAVEDVWLGRGQCIEQHGAGEAYLPLLEALGRLGRAVDSGRLTRLLEQQAPSWLLHLPALLPEAAFAALQQRASGTTRERMLRELADGVEFAVAALAAGVEHAVETVEEQCASLARRGQLLQARDTTTWPDGTVTAQYRFQHTLYQELISQHVPLSRRVRWHQQIGTRLEAAYGRRAPEIAAELAMHFERGRDFRRAVTYLQHAGEHARQRSALQEAVTHLHRGLELLAALPASPEWTEYELALYFTLGLVLATLKGQASPEAGQAYAHAHALCQQLSDTSRLFHVLAGLRRFYAGRGDLQTARTIAEQLHDVAQRSHDAPQRIEAYYSLGLVSFCLGDLPVCRTYLEHGLALSTPQPDRTAPPVVQRDPRGNHRAACLNYASLALWGLGYPDQAVQQSEAAVTYAQQRELPVNRAFALHFAACLRQCRREAQAAQRLAAAAMTLATDYALEHWLGQSTILYGWAVAMQGERDVGLMHLRQGLAAMRSTGNELLLAYYLAQLAEVYGATAQPAAGLAVLEEALALVATHGERWYEAELHRLNGELLLCQAASDVGHAEQCFQRALDIARRQQAKSLELRAAMSLCRLWQCQGKRDEARHLLAEVYVWFTEGGDTADLQEAKILLESPVP